MTEAYQPRTGDHCAQEVHADCFNMYWYVRQCWEPHGSLTSDEKQRLIASWKMVLVGEGEGNRQYYRCPLMIPQFSDESGWSLVNKKEPYFYEHITLAEPRRLKRAQSSRLYKIVMIYPGTEYHHKNTYFIKRAHLERFLQDHLGSEQLVSIERVESMPPTDEKLNQ